MAGWDDWVLHALPCLGEYCAALQIHHAYLGPGRLRAATRGVLLALLWGATQFLFDDYTAYSFPMLLLNAVRFLAATALFGGALMQKCVSVVLCGASLLAYENTLGVITAALRGIRLPDVWNLYSSVLLYGVALNLLVGAVAHALRRSLRDIHPMQRRLSLVYLCCIACLNILLSLLGSTVGTRHYGFVALIGLGLNLSAAISLVFFVLSSAAYAHILQADMHIQQQRRQAEQLMESYQTQRRLTHEFKNHMAALAIYLDKEDLPGARQYMDSIGQTIAQNTPIVNTHNPLLDALLSNEYQKAANQQVELYLDLCDLQNLPLPDTDLVTLMCNLLDNAVRGAKGTDLPQVHLRIRQSGDEFVISVRNRVAQDIELKNGELPPSTKNEPGHGMGLANVTAVIGRYGGWHVLSCQQRWFCFTCGVPCRKL